MSGSSEHVCIQADVEHLHQTTCPADNELKQTAINLINLD